MAELYQELLDLISERDSLRKSEKEITKRIKRLRKRMSKIKQKSKLNVHNRPLLVETREKLRALRISCRRALKEAGYNTKEISEIMGVSYGRLLEIESELKRKAEIRKRKQTITEQELYCRECDTLTKSDPYNPNYIICDCQEIGQIDHEGPYPKKWTHVNTETIIKGR